jgi:Kelch motif
MLLARAQISELELFDPRTSRWRRLPDMPTPRHAVGGAALGNRVFAVEGPPRPGLALSDATEFIDVPLSR